MKAARVMAGIMAGIVAGIVALTGLAAAQAGGALQGKVLNSGTGRPVAGAVVVLQGLDATGNPPQPDSYVLETEADGGFHVETIPAGHYEARAEREGFTNHPRGAAAKPLRLTVERGQPLQDVILKLIPLGTIAGRAVDTDGDPISGAPVTAMGFAYNQGRKELQEFGHALTNDRGEFRIANLAPGRYYLKFSANPRTQVSPFVRVLGPRASYPFAATYYPAAPDLASAVALDLPPGGELRDRTIVASPNQLYALRITISGGAPGSPPMFRFFSPIGMEMMGPVQYGVARQFPNSPPGSYVLEGEDKTGNLWARQTFKVVNSDVDVTLILRPEVVLNGAVRVEGGGPIALDGAVVSLEADDWRSRVEAAVKPDGSFALHKIEPITYRLRLKVPAGGYLQSLRLGERLLASPEIDMARASGTLAIALGTDGAQLDGDAAEGATVVAAPAGPRAAWPDLVRSAVAGKDGKFELRDLAPGDYQVFAFEDAEPGAPLDPDFRKPFEKQATPVHIDANQHATVRLR
jgi:protocatechuate 3,4-dioxygenase beta subunit